MPTAVGASAEVTGVLGLEEMPDKARKRRRTTTLLPPPLENPQRGLSVGVGIHPLDPARLGGSQRLGIIGLPGTGKSTCCRSLLAELCYNYPVINVFSGSETDSPFNRGACTHIVHRSEAYSSIIPRLFVHNRITQKGLKMFVNRQRLAIGYGSPLQDALLILDDCFEEPSALDNSTMRILFKQGRHLHASVWPRWDVFLRTT